MQLFTYYFALLPSEMIFIVCKLYLYAYDYTHRFVLLRIMNFIDNTNMISDYSGLHEYGAPKYLLNRLTNVIV